MCAVTARSRRIMSVLKIKEERREMTPPLLPTHYCMAKSLQRGCTTTNIPNITWKRPDRKKTWPEPLPCAKKYLTLRKDNV